MTSLIWEQRFDQQSALSNLLPLRPHIPTALLATCLAETLPLAASAVGAAAAAGPHASARRLQVVKKGFPGVSV